MLITEKLITLPQDQVIFDDLIEKAQSQVLISRQALPNRDFCDLLIRTKKRGVDVQLLLSDPKYFDQKSVEEIMQQHRVNWDMASYSKITLVEKIEHIRYLEEHDIHPKYIDHDQIFLNHSKFMLIDKEKVFIGSAPNSHIDRLDIGIISTHPIDFNIFQALFDADLAHKPFTVEIGERVAIAPNNSRQVIENLLRSAKKSIHLMFPVITDDPTILEILQQQLSQGVTVNILCSPNIFLTDEEESIDKKYNDKLISYGATLKECYQPIIHCRCILIDAEDLEHSSLYIGSGNLKTSSLDSSREVGIVLKNPTMTTELLTIFQRLYG